MIARLSVSVSVLALCWLLPGILDMGFSWDDREALLENPAIRGFDPGRILSEDYWAARGGAGVYRPVLSLSLAIDHALFGDSAVALHRSTLLLHGLACGALAWVLEKLRPGLLWPAFGILFFHPVAAEQAAWITGRSGSLVYGFGAVALLCALIGRLWLAALIAFVAAHAREDGVLLALVVPLLVPVHRRAWVWPGVFLVASWLLARWLALGAIVPRAAAGLDPLAAFESFGRALSMLLLLEPPVVLGDGSRGAGVLVVALALFVGLAAAAWRRRWTGHRGLVWALLAFVPFSQVVAFGESVAGRFAYPLLPGLTLALGATCLARGVWPRRALLLLPLVLAPFWLFQVSVLADARKTFAQVLDVEPDNRRAVLLLALAEENAGDRAAALRRFRALVAAHPDYAKAHVNLGRLLMLSGEDVEADRVLRTAVRRFPRNARAPLTLGRLLFRRRRFDDAAFAFEEALERNPREGQAARYLCRAFLKLGDVAAAKQALARARAIDARHPALAELSRRVAER